MAGPGLPCSCPSHRRQRRALHARDLGPSFASLLVSGDPRPRRPAGSPSRVMPAGARLGTTPVDQLGEAPARTRRRAAARQPPRRPTNHRTRRATLCGTCHLRQTCATRSAGDGAEPMSPVPAMKVRTDPGGSSGSWASVSSLVVHSCCKGAAPAETGQHAGRRGQAPPTDTDADGP